MDYALLIIIAVQIVGEALPISSSGHLQLASLWFKNQLPEVPNYFDHFLHGFSMVLVLVFFWRAWWGIAWRVMAVVGKMFSGTSWKRLPYSNRTMMKVVGRIILFVVVADVITAVCYGVIKVSFAQSQFLMNPYTLGFGFCVTGVVLVLGIFTKSFEMPVFALRATTGLLRTSAHLFPAHPEEPMQLASRRVLKSTLKKSITLGLVQGLALLPGISRFATTAVAAQFLGYSPRRATQLSFLMFFPLMTAAFLFNGVPHVLGTVAGRALLTTPVLLTMASATALSFPAFALSCYLVNTRRLWLVGVYMLVPLIVLLALVWG